MGNFLKYYQFEMVEDSALLKPLIFCCPQNEIINNAVPLNIPLAKELQKQSSTMMRTMKMESILLNILNLLGDNPVIKDFDVLFNPEYKTDVLKSLINVCRKKQFSAIWPGRFEDGKLFYAEEGYRDYKVYDITNYDVTVII